MLKSVKSVKNLLKIRPRFNFCSQKQQDPTFYKNSRENETYEEKIARYQRIEQNRLKFIGLTASLGGGMIGYCIASYLKKEQHEEDEEKLEQQINNLQTITPLDKELRAEWDDNWDGLQYLTEQEKELKPEEKKRGVRYITLVRHGQYVDAEKAEDKKLTKLGKEQAKQTGKRLKDLGLKFDKVVVSGMVRAQETGEIIGKELNLKKDKVEIVEDPLLSEGYPCEFSPMSESGKKWKEKYESKEDEERISKAFEKYIRRRGENEEGDSHELLVIHGNVIRYLLCRGLQNPGEGWLRMSTSNCGITQLQIRPNGYVSLRRFGESGHMDKKHQSFA